MNQITEITPSPNPVLRNTAKEVPIKDITGTKIQGLISGMKELLKNSKDGVGLAAPQVGKSLRVFIVSEEAEYVGNNEGAVVEIRDQRGGKADHGEVPPGGANGEKKGNRQWKYYVFINPVVKKISRKRTDFPEGCLSIPGRFGMVLRPEKITVEAYDENGKKFTRGASKFTARVIQHELDHINGVLFIDKVHQYLEVPAKGKK